MTVKVPKRVWDAILYLQLSLQVDMYDVPRVCEVCASHGFFEATKWIYVHQDEYLRLLSEGPELID